MQSAFLPSVLVEIPVPVMQYPLDVIFQALIVSKVTYALPAFAGHITVADKNRINKLFRKAFRRHLVSQLFDIHVYIGLGLFFTVF